MPSTKKSKRNIVDLPAKRAEKAAPTPPPGKRWIVLDTPPVATINGMQVTLPSGRTILIPPNDPAQWNEMWRMIAKQLMPHYLENVKNQQRRAA